MAYGDIDASFGAYSSPAVCRKTRGVYRFFGNRGRSILTISTTPGGEGQVPKLFQCLESFFDTEKLSVGFSFLNPS